MSTWLDSAVRLDRHLEGLTCASRGCRPRRGGSVRSLLVADNVPWPPLGGGLVRLAQVVEAVASVSDLDLFVLHNQTRSKVEVPPTVPVVRSKGVQNPRTVRSPPVAPGMGGPPGPPGRGGHAPCRPMRPGSALHDWARPPYDVVWFSTARSYEWLGRPDLGPTIVDLDNLEDVKAGLRAELLADQLRSAAERKLPLEPPGLVSGPAQRQRLAPIPAIGGGAGGAGGDRQRPGRRQVGAAQRRP